jgi:hypothetical protein
MVLSAFARQAAARSGFLRRCKEIHQAKYRGEAGVRAVGWLASAMQLTSDFHSDPEPGRHGIGL